MKNKIIRVVAGILCKNEEFLIASRNKNKILNDCWEFPGGKVEKNENIFLALKRELKEELSIEIKMPSILFDNYFYDYPTISLEIFFFKCRDWNGYIKPVEGQKIKWVKKEEIKNIKLLPSNDKVLKKLFL